MTTANAIFKKDIQKRERLSALLVILLTLLALLLGWAVKTAVTNQTQSFASQGITAEPPAGWLVQEGAGEFVMLARNPAALDQRYRILMLPGGGELTAVAAQRNQNRGRMDDSYTVLEQTPIVADGRDGYKVSYALVNTDTGRLPTIIEGVDYYFSMDNKIVVVSFEAEQADYAANFAQFQDFRASVAYEGGGS